MQRRCCRMALILALNGIKYLYAATCRTTFVPPHLPEKVRSPTCISALNMKILHEHNYMP
jgi:hypothetical protein